MLAGIGFGNSSNTLGHALSYAFSNEGMAHGYALSSCTAVAHRFNESKFYEPFKEAVKKLGFEKLELKAPVEEAADVVMEDRAHLDNNPRPVEKDDVVGLLTDIVKGNL